MNTVLWMLAGALAAFFLFVGVTKLLKPYDQLRAQMAWVEDFNSAQVKTIAALEILAAIGLILPAVLDVLPILTPLAASGLVLTMIGAAITHGRRSEWAMVLTNIVLAALALFVAIERFGPHAL